MIARYQNGFNIQTKLQRHVRIYTSFVNFDKVFQRKPIITVTVLFFFYTPEDTSYFRSFGRKF